VRFSPQFDAVIDLALGARFIDLHKKQSYMTGQFLLHEKEHASD